MIGKTNAGGGGASLNFKVIAYTSEADLLFAAPAENTIGIITDQKITSWHFADEAPAEAEEGMVWIWTGEGSNVAFNALKKNGITLYPVHAMQFANGAWADVEAKSYQNGRWVDWFSGLHLYNAGDKCLDVVGGWTEKVGTYGVIKWNENSVRLGYSGTTSRYSSIYTEERIDLTEYDVLCARVSDLEIDGDRFLVGVRKSWFTGTSAAQAESGFAAIAKLTQSVTGEYLVEVDISSLTGSYYVQIIAGITIVDVKEIYLGRKYSYA